MDGSRRLDDAQRDAVTELALAAQAEDGVAPLSEQGLLNLRGDGGEGVTHLLLTDDTPAGGSVGDSAAGVERASDHAGELRGYAQLDARPGGEPSAELVVVPRARRRGLGRRLLDETLDRQPDARVWTHGALPGALALAESAGLGVVRELLKMARELRAGDDFPVALPPGFELETYTPADGPDWVALNAAAFVEHAEQGRMTLADLREREAEPWFDPAGFFLVRDEAGELAAFHWTKVEHGVGEVYVVGVSPAHQGLGLGRAVTAIGLRHLRDAGLPRVELYVDGHNAAAVTTYERQGFAVVARDAQWARPAR